MNRSNFRALATTTLVTSLLLAACAGLDRREHSLAGRAWSERAGSFVDSAEIVSAVAHADFILLGETHDLPAHHQRQADLIRAAAANRSPAVVLEMVGRDRQTAIDRWRREDGDAASFGPAVEWEERGWPDWAMYRPIIAAAVELNLPILAAAPPADMLRAVGRDGLDSLDRGRRLELGLERPLPEPGRSRLEATLHASHCGIGGSAMVGAMLQVQRLRDAYFAETMRTAASEHDAAILVAGRGHTRNDHGVPLYLTPRDGSSSIVTVALAGIGEFGDVDALRRSGGGAIAHDYAWFTDGGRPAPACVPG